jgi:hemerythrin superfamily protein
MNAIDLLRSDHEAVSDLFEEFEDAEESEQGIIAEQVCALLTVHARIEEEIFYPAVRQAFGNEGEELADEALVEHDGIGKLVEEIAAADAGDAMFRAKVKVLGEYVRHHVREEEGAIFPRLRRGAIDLDVLGEELGARKNELIGEMELVAGLKDDDELVEEDEDEEDDDVGASAVRRPPAGERPTGRYKNGSPTTLLRSLRDVDQDLGAFLAVQALEPVFDQVLERNGLHPTSLRIRASGHLGDHRRKRVAGQGDAGDPRFRHQDVHCPDVERLRVDGDHDDVAVDGRTVERGLERHGHAGGVHGCVGSATAGEILDGGNHVPVARIENLPHSDRLEDGAAGS